MDIKIGDVVWLKSGGPAMTVREHGRFEGYFSCNWFYNGDVKYEDFHISQLTKEKPN